MAELTKMPLPVEHEKGQNGTLCLEEDDDDEEEEDVTGNRPPTPPDGGWGWWVVLASFLCNMIVDGVCFSFGVVSCEYRNVFGVSHSEVGWVGSSLAGCYLLVGPFVSALCSRYGCRKVTIIGSIVTMFGFILSTQSQSVQMLIVTYGVIGGVGFGMIYLPSIVCVGYWFEKKRAFTTGIAVCGTGMGQLAFPPLAHYLLTEYGWEGQNLIMAGIVLHCAVCGMTFLPLDRQYFKRRKRVKRIIEIERGEIMKALIKDKERQRTISNGSLDNCIITKDNRLIKLDPKILECKRNNSFIAKIKRQLGFSSQSLACSKTSIQVPSIVIDAVQNLNKTYAAPIYRPNGLKDQESHIHSNLVKKRCSLPEGSSPHLPNGNVPVANGYEAVQKLIREKKRCSLPEGDVLKSSPISNRSFRISKGSSNINGVLKTRSCDVIPRDESLWIGQSQDEGIVFQAKESVESPSVSKSVTDLESLSIPSPSLAGSVISIQLIEGGAPDVASVRYRSSHSMASGFSDRVTSSEASYVTGSFLSIPQTLGDADELECKLQQNSSVVWKCWHILCDMFDVRLLLNPVFALLSVSSFVTLLAFYVPFFYLPNKGVMVGMSESAATFLLSIVGVTNTIGRLLCGWLADRPWVNALHLTNIALLVAGVAILLCPFCNSEAPLAVLAAVFGLCVAVYVSLRSVLLVDLLGLEMLTKSFGLLILFQGMAAFIGAPIAGGLRDATGDVNDCFYLAGSLTILSGLLMLPILKLRKAGVKKKLPPTAPDSRTVTETMQLERIDS